MSRLIRLSIRVSPVIRAGPVVNGLRTGGRALNTAASDNFQLSQGGQGFAIPIPGGAMAIAGQIRSGGVTHRSYQAYRLPRLRCCRQQQRRRTSPTRGRGAPAASLGISTGDVITAVDGAPIQLGHRGGH